MNELCLKECLSIIEKKLGWGPSKDWLNQDFQLLSDRIFEDTRVRLSITTLKRVWGKVNYESAPSISTLNTLAQFVGLENWSAFKQSQNGKIKTPKEVRVDKPKLLVPLSAGVVVVIAIIMLTSFNREGKFQPITTEDLEGVIFTSQPTSFGLPNSVIFNYDLNGIKTEKAFIQQSWNERLTFEIDKDGHEASALYYLPGYFKAKLIAQDQIIKEHDVHVKTDGWMGSITGGDQPAYLYGDDLEKDEHLRLSSSTKEALKTNELESPMRANFHYSNDLGEIYGDDFTFETRFRNTYEYNNGACKKASVMIHGSEGAFIIDTSIPGCVSDLEIFHVGSTVDGKSNDLSAFGLNYPEWQTLKCVAKGNNIQILVNGKLAREISPPNELGRIVGFRYIFEGYGEVDFVKLSKNKEVFYSEDF